MRERTAELVALAKKVDAATFARTCPGLFLLAERSELELPRKSSGASTTKLNIAFATVPMPGAPAAHLPPSGFAIIEVVRGEHSPFADMVSVGRATANDIVIRHSTVSKLHACFSEPEKGEWLLSDHGSSNGTWFAGERLAEGEARALTGDDMIAFGECHCAVKKADALWKFLEKVRQGS